MTCPISSTGCSGRTSDVKWEELEDEDNGSGDGGEIDNGKEINEKEGKRESSNVFCGRRFTQQN